jgi:hypothetical protein
MLTPRTPLPLFCDSRSCSPQVGNDLQNSELEESEPDQAVRGGWDLEQYRIKQTIKGNFGAISGPLACTR